VGAATPADLGLLAPVPFVYAAIRLHTIGMWLVAAIYVLAVAAALTARERRERAREIIASDPALARELRIGRPDLPRQFDDGGLVDVNYVPAPVLVDRLGLSQEAARVAEARARLGRFSSPAELAVYAELPDASVRPSVAGCCSSGTDAGPCLPCSAMGLVRRQRSNAPGGGRETAITRGEGWAARQVRTDRRRATTSPPGPAGTRRSPAPGGLRPDRRLQCRLRPGHN
jgi:hypothetical protein